jgi:hypothetical protein
MLYVKFGEEFINYMEQRYLNTLHISPTVFEVNMGYFYFLQVFYFKILFKEHNTVGKE